MPFVDLRLSDIEIEKPQPLPAGGYIWQLQPGAFYRTNQFTNIEELNVRFDVAEGDFQGRVEFVSYPDPSTTTAKGKSNKWAAQALKKLEIALGVDSMPGEDPASFLNRAATSGYNRLSAQMVANNYTKNGVEVQDTRFGVFTVGAAA